MLSRLDEAFPAAPPDDAAAHARSAAGIDGADLRGELERLPAMVAYYGVQYAAACREQMAAKAALAEVEQAHYLSLRDDAEALGERATEATLTAKVGRLAPVRLARSRLVEAEYEREATRAICDALRAKREALNGLVHLARAEMAGAPTPWRGSGEDLDA